MHLIFCQSNVHGAPLIYGNQPLHTAPPSKVTKISTYTYISIHFCYYLNRTALIPQLSACYHSEPCKPPAFHFIFILFNLQFTYIKLITLNGKLNCGLVRMSTALHIHSLARCSLLVNRNLFQRFDSVANVEFFFLLRQITYKLKIWLRYDIQ